MRVREIFLSYAHIDEADALYVRSVIDSYSLNTALEYMSSQRNKVVEAFFAAAAWVASNDDVARTRAKTWMDKDIPAGVDWNTAIRNAITRSFAVVVLVPNQPSPQVGAECGIAMSSGKPIVPVTRTISDLQPYNLQGYQAVQWPSHDDRDDWSVYFRDKLADAGV